MSPWILKPRYLLIFRVCLNKIANERFFVLCPLYSGGCCSFLYFKEACRLCDKSSAPYSYSIGTHSCLLLYYEIMYGFAVLCLLL